MHFLHIKNIQKYSSGRWQLGRCSWGTLLQLFTTAIRLQKQQTKLLTLASIMLRKIHFALPGVNFSRYWHESLLWHSLWFVGGALSLARKSNRSCVNILNNSFKKYYYYYFFFIAKPFWLPHLKIVRFMDNVSAITFSFKSYIS